jgi:hypothetical protein
MLCAKKKKKKKKTSKCYYYNTTNTIFGLSVLVAVERARRNSRTTIRPWNTTTTTTTLSQGKKPNMQTSNEPSIRAHFNETHLKENLFFENVNAFMTVSDNRKSEQTPQNHNLSIFGANFQQRMQMSVVEENREVCSTTTKTMTMGVTSDRRFVPAFGSHAETADVVLFELGRLPRSAAMFVSSLLCERSIITFERRYVFSISTSISTAGLTGVVVNFAPFSTENAVTLLQSATKLANTETFFV